MRTLRHQVAPYNDAQPTIFYSYEDFMFDVFFTEYLFTVLLRNVQVIFCNVFLDSSVFYVVLSQQLYFLFL